MDPKEYPEIPSFPADGGEDVSQITLNGDALRYAFEKTSFAMSKEEMRPAMMGTLFDFEEDGLRVVATDGHRLSNLLNKNIKS